MTTFHVDANELEIASGHITRTIESLHSDIATLTTQLRGLDGSWSGPAALAFSTIVDEWTHSSVRMTETLDAMGTALRQVHAHYLETEAANVRLLGR